MSDETPLTQLILDTAMNAFVSMDTDGLIREWNLAAERIFGHAKAEVLGQSVADLIIPRRYRAAHREGLARFLATGDGPVLGKRLELEAVRADGSEFPVEMTIRALEHRGELTFHAFIADVTVRREAEASLTRANAQLRQADELKSRFLAMASHELRTPLTAIEGFTSTMLHRWDQLDDSEKVRFLEIVDTQSRRLSRLVEDLLTLSRVESGKLHVQPSAVHVASAIKRVLSDLNVDSAVTVLADDNVHVLADDVHLTQILVNFVGNALKYGGPPIEIEVAADGQWADLAVCDHGAGVPQEFEGQLFEPFARARHDASAPHGSGLGLSIVRGLVEAQGGIAWYEPNEPAGARFTARLPRAPGS